MPRSASRYALLAIVAMTFIALAGMALLKQQVSEAPAPKAKPTSEAAEQAAAMEREKELHALNEAVREQQTVVEQKRQALAAYIRGNWIPFPEDQMQLRRRMLELEADLMGLERPDERDVWFHAAHNLDEDSKPMAILYKSHRHQRRILTGMEINGVPADEPQFILAQRDIRVLEEVMNRKIAMLKLEFRKQLDEAKAEMAKMIPDPPKLPQSDEYQRLKLEFEQEHEKLQALKLKQIAETLSPKY